MSSYKQVALSLRRELQSIFCMPQTAVKTRLDRADLDAHIFNLIADYCQANNISHQVMSRSLAYLEQGGELPVGTLHTWHREGRYALESDHTPPDRLANIRENSFA